MKISQNQQTVTVEFADGDVVSMPAHRFETCFQRACLLEKADELETSERYERRHHHSILTTRYPGS
jgi:hypothetical protein